MKKSSIALASLSPALAFAEGETGLATLPSQFTTAISTGEGYVVTILTAGAAIVALFWTWKLLKRALFASK